MTTNESVKKIIQNWRWKRNHMLKNQNKILPCGTLAQGQYGISEQVLRLPVILSWEGGKKVIEIKLTSEEQKELVVSASHVKELCNFIDESGLI